MLESVKITRRQSEIRQVLAELVGKETPTDDETRSMESLDKEYHANETRYRAALISEDTERREAGAELETRDGREWSELVGKFEVRQAVFALDEGRQLDGATAEIVSELRSAGGYRGIPVPLEALEIRAGETVSTGTPDPISTAPIIDRLFASSKAAMMGGQFISIDHGEREYPVVTSSVSAGWTAGGETDPVPGPEVFATTDRALAPDHTLGIQMRITRKALKQSGTGLEQAVRRDMASAMRVAMDAAVFQGGTGAPTGLLELTGIGTTLIDASPTYDIFRSAGVEFMKANAASGLGDIRALVRPEQFDDLDSEYALMTLPDMPESSHSHWDRLTRKFGAVHISSNALPDPDGSNYTSAVLSTNAGGVAPFVVGTWGAVDLIRDPYSDAASGGLRLTALTTADLTPLRLEQLHILSQILRRA